MSRKNTIETFHERIDKSGECWIWTGTKFWDGYGRFQYEGRSWRAHKLSYIFHKGEPKKGLHILHSCHNPICVNPDHLREGTQKENAKDAKDAERLSRGEGRPAAKLTEDDVRVIRARLSLGATLISVAKDFGISETCVCHIKKGRNWSHVL